VQSLPVGVCGSIWFGDAHSRLTRNRLHLATYFLPFPEESD
jgi:hypothetical protein